MDFEDLSPELQEKAKACKTTDELQELARAEGMELSDEQLAAISAGGVLQRWGICDDYDCRCVSDEYGCAIHC